MAQQADITVYDGAATPVAHVLKAISSTKEKGKITAFWSEKLASLPDYAQVTLTATAEKLKSGVWKTSVRVAVPVMESVSGQNAAGYTAAPKVAYVNTVETVGYFHERSDVAGRRLARQMAINTLGNVATSVAAATTGMAPDLVDQLIMPS